MRRRPAPLSQIVIKIVRPVERFYPFKELPGDMRIMGEGRRRTAALSPLMVSLHFSPKLKGFMAGRASYEVALCEKCEVIKSVELSRSNQPDVYR